MLRCPYCKVNISTKTTVCPLCHTDLIAAGTSPTQIKKMESAFPKRARLQPLRTSLFDIIYLIVSLNIVIASISAELIIVEHIKIAWIIAALLLYFYVFLRFTLKKDEYFPQKVAGQAILLTIVFFTTRTVLPEPRVIIEYILPTIYLVSTLMIGIFILINYKKPNKFILNLMSIALLSVAPYVVATIAHTESRVFALVTAVVGASIFITTAIFYSKPLLSELKRNFHA